MLDQSAVDHVAELAKLGLSEAERETFREQLSKVLDYVDQIAALEADLAAGPAGTGAAVGGVRLRPDVVRPSLDRATALANAADVEAGQFRVPRLLE
jgi:aspartyl-tRNA(Asn)/glutamyl-tRNA(Gln) amidotransferase subunit C